MKGPKKLLETENNWVTKMGAWFPGERVVYRNIDLFHGLKDKQWMELFLLGITGRFFNKNQIRLFEGIWTISTSYPDSRLWNNGIASLAGTNRSTATLGISAAIAISEATIYGHRPIIGAFDFLLRTKKKLDEGYELSEIIKNEFVKYRNIYGYGRPIVKRDERIEPLMDLARALGFANGVYVDLAFQLESVIQSQGWRQHMNIAALAAALVADQGFSSREYYHYLVPCFIAGIIPCYIEAQDRSEGTFLPLRCSRVNYEGKTQRKWG